MGLGGAFQPQLGRDRFPFQLARNIKHAVDQYPAPVTVGIEAVDPATFHYHALEFPLDAADEVTVPMLEVGANMLG